MTQFCVIVCGRLPGDRDDVSVWAPIAKAFKMDSSTFALRVLPRMPLVVKHDMDEPSAAAMVDRMRAIGIDAMSSADDGKRVFFERHGELKGPLPLVCLGDFIAPGARYRMQGEELWSLWPDPTEDTRDFSFALDEPQHEVPLAPSPVPAPAMAAAPTLASPSAAAPEFDGPAHRRRPRKSSVRPRPFRRLMVALILLLGAAGGAAWAAGYWPTVVHCVRDGSCSRTGPYPMPREFAQRWNVLPPIHDEDDSDRMMISQWHTCSSATGDRCLVARVCGGHGTIVASRQTERDAYDYAVGLNQAYERGWAPDSQGGCSTALLRAVNALFDAPADAQHAVAKIFDDKGIRHESVNGVAMSVYEFKSPAGIVTMRQPEQVGDTTIPEWKRFAAMHSDTIVMNRSAASDGK